MLFYVENRGQSVDECGKLETLSEKVWKSSNIKTIQFRCEIYKNTKMLRYNKNQHVDNRKNNRKKKYKSKISTKIALSEKYNLRFGVIIEQGSYHKPLWTLISYTSPTSK